MFGKIRKSLHFFHHRRVFELWTIITLSNWELFVQPGDEKASKTHKLFIFLKKILVCLFPINTRDFKPKKAFFSQKQGKNGGKQTNSNFFQKNKKFECFRCFFIPWLYQKLRIWKSYDCSNTPMMGKMEDFSYFSKKSSNLH